MAFYEGMLCPHGRDPAGDNCMDCDFINRANSLEQKSQKVDFTGSFCDLREAIENYTGLVARGGDSKGSRTRATLNMYANENSTVLIAKINLYKTEKGWQFGGSSSFCPDNWQELCQLHEEK